jgi:Ser/Thr protein kinase RdoA (MazF antagonist)
VGHDTLEQRPDAAGYRAAVRALADMRREAARRLRRDPSIAAGLRLTTADVLDAGRRAGAGLAALRPDLAGCLDRPTQVLIDRLRRVTEPETLVHGDFHAKNLVHAPDGRVVVVDWPGASVHGHLGDLYCLCREAGRRGRTDVEGVALPDLFAREAGLDPRTVAEHMTTGGLCWTVLVLRWMVEEGLQVVPESRGWVDDLVTDCRRLAG